MLFKNNLIQIYESTKIKASDNTYLEFCVGVVVLDFFPSIAARCCSKASSKLLGALVKSGISPLSIPTFYKKKKKIVKVTK